MNACLFPAEPSTKRHTLAGGMSTPKDVDLTPLLAELKLRRLNSKNTSHPIKQPEIARALGVSSVQVSRLESGSRSLHNLTGSQVYTFLRGYLYSPSEILGIVTRYKLNMPPELVEEMAAASGMVTVMDEGAVSRPNEPTPVAVPAAWVFGYDPNSVTIRRVKSSDLVTQRAKSAAMPGTILTVSRSERPTDGSLVILQAGDVQVLAVWPVERQWATPYDPDSGDSPVLVDATLPIVAVVVSSTRQHPVERGGA